ncbi:MAG: FAD-binding oxidoreductase [Desulfobacteraceae bacterium]|nr:FAD-binding oxidoreductase [Desulfobacteraceae bacterium]
MADFKELVGELAGIVGREFIKTGPGVIRDYAVDEMVPEAVIFPGNAEEVSGVVKLANRENMAIIPCGNRTKMAMGNLPARLDVVVCTSRMNHMIDVDTSNLTITIESGVKFRDIQARLATQEDRCYLPLDDLVTEADEVICSDRSHSGCFLPIDPCYADSATIGGIIAANSSGSRRLLYRNIRDSILGVRMVAPTGEILGSGGKTVKNVSGYDVSKLAVGSMGSLGMICEMTLKLLPLPEKMETLLISFGSFSQVSSFIEEVFESHLLPAGVDVMNQEAYSYLNMDGIPDLGSNGYVSAIAIEGFEQAVDRMRTEIMGMAKTNGARSNAQLQEERHLLFWLAVSNLDGALADRGADLVKTKLNYPISEWRGIAESVEKTFSHADLDYTLQIHAGNGICLPRLLILPNDVEAMDRGIRAINSLLARCREVGGNLVVEGAPAEVKDRLKIWGETGSDFVVMKRIKEQIDPSGIMSPGRFVGGL